MLGGDTDFNVQQISKFSSKDAQAFPKFEHTLQSMGALAEVLLDEIPIPMNASYADLWNSRGLIKKLLAAARQLGPRGVDAFLKLMLRPADEVLRGWFESEPLLSTLATDAIIGANQAPSSPQSGYVLLHHVMGETGGKKGMWAYVQGGVCFFLCIPSSLTPSLESQVGTACLCASLNLSLFVCLCACVYANVYVYVSSSVREFFADLYHAFQFYHAMSVWFFGVPSTQVWAFCLKHSLARPPNRVPHCAPMRPSRRS